MLHANRYGDVRVSDTNVEELSTMKNPVMCKWCRGVHDSAAVEVVSRYMDCSTWKCPKCGVLLDDRHPRLGGSAIPVDVYVRSDDGSTRTV